MSSSSLHSLFLFLLVLFQISNIFGFYPEYRAPLSVVSDISSRLATHSPRAGKDLRLPLPTLPLPQDLEAIKKVAQILVTLGEQVIPAILGDTQPGHKNEGGTSIPVVDVPNDPVN